MTIAFGIDLGGTRIKAGAFADSGEKLADCLAPTDDGDADSQEAPRFAQHVKELIAELERLTKQSPAAIGISAPGLPAKDGRSIAVMPGRMRGLEGFDWSEWLGRPVPVLNDAQAALLGEVWTGAARPFEDAILLTLGTGVGGAIWSGGRLVRGAIGRAGHFGHMSLDPSGEKTITGMPGGLEDWIGNHNVAARTNGRFMTTYALVAAYETGDAFAREVWEKSVRGLGCAIASLINILDPEAVIIGGGIASAGSALFDPLARVLEECEWRPAGERVKIIPAQLGEWAGTYGAAWNALQSIS
jgi:glucokinase